MCLAVPMKVVELIPPDRAVVESDGISMDISRALVDHVNVGDYVIVHAGFALEVIDLEEAEKTLATLHEIAMTAEGASPP
ncbi:HypC/HybG/HupF family hydrogenase formation chaperone [bacterium]|nr:HypC/HybG/HupF family hydrogenase formation chaperone [bacterium]